MKLKLTNIFKNRRSSHFWISGYLLGKQLNLYPDNLSKTDFLIFGTYKFYWEGPKEHQFSCFSVSPRPCCYMGYDFKSKFSSVTRHPAQQLRTDCTPLEYESWFKRGVCFGIDFNDILRFLVDSYFGLILQVSLDIFDREDTIMVLVFINCRAATANFRQASLPQW